jgi:hypothetical protein
LTGITIDQRSEVSSGMHLILSRHGVARTERLASTTSGAGAASAPSGRVSPFHPPATAYIP